MEYNHWAVLQHCDDSANGTVLGGEGGDLNTVFEGKLTACKAVAAVCHLDALI